MTLAELSSAWSALRTAAVGRSGLELYVSAQLASRIRRGEAAFRNWYADAGPVDEALGSAPGTSASYQIQVLRTLQAAAKAEGLAFAGELPETAGEAFASTITSGVKLITLALVAAAAVGIARSLGRR